MCRWLLRAQDTVGGDILNLTQEFLSHMFGARRTSASGSANEVQEEGLMKYKRGGVLDRKGPEKCSCECYAVFARRADRHHARNLSRKCRAVGAR